MARQVAAALGLPDDYFPEYREAMVHRAIRRDPRLRDEIFDREVTATLRPERG
jgi:hypothetical protein